MHYISGLQHPKSHFGRVLLTSSHTVSVNFENSIPWKLLQTYIKFWLDWCPFELESQILIQYNVTLESLNLIFSSWVSVLYINKTGSENECSVCCLGCSRMWHSKTPLHRVLIFWNKMEVIMEVNRKGLLVKKRGGIIIYHYTINCSLTATVLFCRKMPNAKRNWKLQD